MYSPRPRLGILYLTAFVDMVGLAMVLPLLPFHAGNLGASASVIGLLIAAFSLAQLLAAPLWGRYSDRAGRRPAILAGLVVGAAGYALFAAAGSVAALLVSRIIQGIGAGTIGVVQACVADATAPAERTRRLGWLSAITSLGAVAGPALGSLLAAGGRWLPGVTAAAGSGLVALLAWRLLPETLTESDHAGPEAPVQGTPGRLRQGGLVFRLVAIYAVGIGAFYGLIPAAPLLLKARLGYGPGAAGWFIMYLGAIGVVVRAGLLGRMVDRLGETRLATLGILLLAAGLMVTGAASGRMAMLAGFTLMPLGTACLFPGVTAMLSNAVGSEERGAVLGLQQSAGGVCRVAFPLAAGVLMDVTGPGAPFVVAGALALATLPLLRGSGAATGYRVRSPSWTSRPIRSM